MLGWFPPPKSVLLVGNWKGIIFYASGKKGELCAFAFCFNLKRACVSPADSALHSTIYLLLRL